MDKEITDTRAMDEKVKRAGKKLAASYVELLAMGAPTECIVGIDPRNVTMADVRRFASLLLPYIE
jgi:hypothetical protein